MRTLTATELLLQYNNGTRDFSGVKLHAGNFVGTVLRDAVFAGADLSFSNFEGADLTGADFTGAIASRCSFHNAFLRNAAFKNADLSYAVLRNVQLEGASFSGANLMWAHLCGNSLLKADLSGAQLDWSCLVDAQLAPDQIALVPQHAVLSLSQEEHTKQLSAEPRLTTYVSSQASVGRGYESRTATEQVMANYVMPAAQKKDGKSQNYC